jgi:hypothetical protein
MHDGQYCKFVVTGRETHYAENDSNAATNHSCSADSRRSAFGSATGQLQLFNLFLGSLGRLFRLPSVDAGHSLNEVERQIGSNPFRQCIGVMLGVVRKCLVGLSLRDRGTGLREVNQWTTARFPEPVEREFGVRYQPDHI